jgi:pimeloyl-ACP methyl ester carboxylesterase
MNAPLPNLYDPANAARLCQASAEAYSCSVEAVPRLIEPEAQRYIIENHATDTRAVITQSNDDLIIAFRGTRDLRNWLTDLDCAFTPSVCGRVHAGFAAALNSAFAQVAETIFDAHCAGKRIWLTGHSLGGALALLCARQLIKPLAGCYTFGQPRVGDATFCAAYDALLKDRTHRVVHDADIVPRVPWLLGAYRHAGHEAFYPHPKLARDNAPADGGSIRISQWQLDPSLWAKLPGDALSLANGFFNGKLSMLNDHHISTYQTFFAERLADDSSAATDGPFLQTA